MQFADRGIQESGLGLTRPIFELQLPIDRKADKTAAILNHLAGEGISGEWWMVAVEF